MNLNENVVKKAKSMGINISAAAERGIINHIKELENIGSENNNSNNCNHSSDGQDSAKNHYEDRLVGPPRFELESLAPKAKRIDQATLRAQHFFE